jgi:methionine-R-sulfoxide reductase
MSHSIKKTDAEWRAQLSDEQYQVARQCGTEPPFTGIYWDEHAAGMYRCVCCDSALFNSQTKFDSGSGWPSFYQAEAAENVLINAMCRTAWCVTKCVASIAARISVTFFLMVRSRLDCAFALTPPHLP